MQEEGVPFQFQHFPLFTADPRAMAHARLDGTLILEPVLLALVVLGVLWENH